MALIEILPDTHPVLRKTCRKVKHVDDKLRQLIADMYETMVDNFGIGLAAPQVGATRRFFIYEIPKRDPKDSEEDTSEKDEVAEEEDDVKNLDAEVSETADESDIDESDEDNGWEYTGDYTVCINPKIIEREGLVIDEEGCLSKDGWIAKVERAYKITFQAYDLDMNRFERTVTGLEARCVLHETDHLDGILFTDRAVPGSLKELCELDFDEDDDKETDGTQQPDAGSEEKITLDKDESSEVSEGSSVVTDT